MRVCVDTALFPAQFVYHTILSFVLDMVQRTPTMEKVMKVIALEQLKAISDAMTMGPIRDKPLIRCENCTKTQQEKAFMLCSHCKSKLDFTVHHCSQYALILLLCYMQRS